MSRASTDRLAVFLPSLVGGGAERVCLNLALALAGRGYPVDLVLASASGEYLSEVPSSIRVIDLASKRVATSFPGLVRYLRRERPRAVLSAMSHANIAAILACSMARVPTRVVASEHDTLSKVVDNTTQRRVKALPFLIRAVYPRSNAVIAVSAGVAEDLASVARLPRSIIHTVYNPVVTPSLRAAAVESPHHPWFVSESPPVVVGVGRLAPKKDFPTLIRAFAIIRRTRPARLMILGEGPDRGELVELIRDLGVADDVELPGFLPNPYSSISRASVFVLSSLWEGLPTVLIEAMFCGVPVVSTDCPSGPREILDEGRYGTLVPVGDVTALSVAIDNALDGCLVPPPEESWRPYELDRVVDQYLELLVGEV